MRSIWVIEWTIVAILIVMFVSQIIVPTILGSPMFPLLRRRGREVENQLAAAREDVEIAAKQASLKNLKQKTRRKTK